MLYKVFPQGQKFSLTSELYHHFRQLDHLALLFKLRDTQILKVYLKGDSNLIQWWGQGCWFFEVQHVNFQEDKENGFETVSVHGSFDAIDFTSLTIFQSLELLENWLTCRGICLLQLRNQIGICIEQKQALEVVNCSEVEKNYFFGSLKRALKVLVVHENQMPSHLHLGLSQMDVLWLEAEGSVRDAGLISLLVGEKTPRRKFKKKKLLVDSCPSLKLIFKNKASNVFPSVDLGYGFVLDIPFRPLDPKAWIKILSSFTCFEFTDVPCPDVSLKTLIECPHESQNDQKEEANDCPSTVQWEDVEDIIQMHPKLDKEEENQQTPFLSTDPFLLLQEVEKQCPDMCSQDSNGLCYADDTPRFSTYNTCNIPENLLESALFDLKAEEIVTSALDQYCGAPMTTSETSRHVTGDFGIQQLTGDR